MIRMEYHERAEYTKGPEQLSTPERIGQLPRISFAS